MTPDRRPLTAISGRGLLTVEEGPRRASSAPARIWGSEGSHYCGEAFQANPSASWAFRRRLRHQLPKTGVHGNTESNITLHRSAEGGDHLHLNAGLSCGLQGLPQEADQGTPGTAVIEISLADVRVRCHLSSRNAY